MISESIVIAAAEQVTALVKLLHKNSVARGIILAFSLLALLGTLILALLAKAGPITFWGRSLSQSDLGPFLFAGGFVLLVVLMVTPASFSDPSEALKLRETRTPSDSDQGIGLLLEALAGTRQLHFRRTREPNGDKKSEPENIIDAIKGNLGQVLQYYVMNIGQARNSFRASLTAVIVGFVTIIVGVWWAYSNNMSNNSAYIVAIAGVVLQFIGGGYFYLYNRSLIQLNFFFTRLALMQDALLAIRLSESLPEGTERNRVLGRLIFAIAERGTTAPAYLPDIAPAKPRLRKAAPKPTEAKN